MRRSLNSSAPSASATPLTRAQLQAAIESEERRQGLAPDSLVSETTVEEAAKKLGLSPDELCDRALRAAPTNAANQTRAASPIRTPFARKLFTVGVVLALALTGFEVATRLKLDAPVRAWIQKANRKEIPFSPIDGRFQSLLAQTIGPNATREMLVCTPHSDYGREFFPLAAVPDGYDVGSVSHYFMQGHTQRADMQAIRFQPKGAGGQEQRLPFRYVRQGDSWYARAWIAPEELSQISQAKLDVVDVAVYSSPRDGLREVVFPVKWIEGPQSSSGPRYVRLPKSFRLNDALLAQSKKPGASTTIVPVPLVIKGDVDRRIQDFYYAGFTASSNLVKLQNMPEGKAFSAPKEAITALGFGHLDVVDNRPSVMADWNLVRHGKKIYLRGWIGGPVNALDAVGQESLRQQHRERSAARV